MERGGTRTGFIVVLAACGLFVLLGLMLIPYAGLETDEVVFANPFFQPIDDSYQITVLHHRIPLMVISYAGTLKTLLWWPILGVFGANVLSVRLPMVIAGAVTIFLFYRLAERMAGQRAALLAALLLATDPIFLLTNTFDWGPVALEHLLLVAGCLAIAKRRIGWGFFCFGLALWDKAVFLWALAGLTAGVIAAYWPEVRRVMRDPQAVTRAVCGFLIGALPFLVYNVHRPNDTLGSNAHFSTENFREKFHELELAANGSGLFDFLASEEWTAKPKAPVSLHGKAALWIREHSGARHVSLFFYAIGLALLAAPLCWRWPGRRAGVFAAVFSAVTFLAMAVTRNAGGAVHHTVLLWPMPHLLAGIAIAAFRPRWLLPLLGTVLIAANLLVINQYTIQFERNGADANFTDALYNLSNSLSDTSGDVLYVVDWGMFDNLSFLHHARLDMRGADGPLHTASPDADQRKEIATMLADPHGLFLSHVPEREMWHGIGEHLVNDARAAGYEKQLVKTIADSNGRPVFELFRFRLAGS